MKSSIDIPGAVTAAGRNLLLGVLLGSLATPVLAGEIQSLAWEGNEDTPKLRIRVDGKSAYKVQSLEDGQRLRISFPNSTLGPKLTELSGEGKVKGVYPYLADNGTAVNVDLLLIEPGRIDVQKIAGGYRVTTVFGAAEPAAAAIAEPPAPSAADKNVIEDMVYAKLPGDRIQITLKMSKTPTEPAAFSITNPPRIALDFPKMQVARAKKTLQIKAGAVSNVTAVEVEDRTRVVLSLYRPVSYATNIEDKTFVVTLESPTGAVAGKEPPKTTRFASTTKAGKFSLSTIDFRRGPTGDAKIIIGLSDPTVGIDIREQAGEIIMDFLNTSVAADLQRRLDVVDFATPVQTIDTFVQGKNTRMVITPKGKYEHVAYQAGNVFTVSIKPIIEKPDEKKVDEFGYSGEKLSLNFQNIDVRAALQVLADFTGLNFVVSDTVKGSLTLRLKDVPWDQALDLILDSKNLAVRRKGNVLTIAPAAEVAAKEKAAFESTKAIVELEPLVSELIQINYAKADDIANLLKSIKAVTTSVGEHPVFGPSSTGSVVQATTESNTLLSPRGQVTVDARTNSLLIQDTPGKIREVRRLIAQLDLPVRQGLIENRFVEATAYFSQSLGAKLGHLNDRGTGIQNTRMVTTGNLNPMADYLNTGTFEIAPGGLNVNLPSGGIR